MIQTLLDPSKKALFCLILCFVFFNVKAYGDTLFGNKSYFSSAFNVPIGYQFHVGPNPITVYKVGLPAYAPGDSGSHFTGYTNFVVEIKDTNGNTLNSTSLNITPGATGQTEQ